MEDQYFESQSGMLCRKSFTVNESLAFSPARELFTRNEYWIWSTAKEKGSATITKEKFDSAIAPFLEQSKDTSQDMEIQFMKNNSDPHPKYSHVYATLEERVEILARNPYRFYISIGVWTFQDIHRLESLDECLEIALAQERHELCARILEVKGILSEKYLSTKV